MTVSPRSQEVLAELGLELHAGLGVRGAYAATRRVGTTLWVSGVTGRSPAGPGIAGIVGESVTVEQARDGARQAARTALGVASLPGGAAVELDLAAHVTA
ncbi:RidA family protein [Nonomuraea rosea]|uniref:RidA family protein n=1 Tax=Nonomuraea rosea TaxID=638574 RepID=A0ABP6ZC01_9ACTN